MRTYCDKCEESRNVTSKAVEREYTVKDTNVKVTINILICDECNEEVYDRDNEIKNDIIVFDAYKKANNLLTSKEIIAIRKKYGLSQSLLSRILGFGEKTITRYENGKIQDKAHDALLRLVNIDQNLFMMLGINKEFLNDKENLRIQTKYAKNREKSFVYDMSDCQSTYETTFEEKGSTGFGCY